MQKKLKIAYISYPEKAFKSGSIKSGSIIVNQQIAEYLKENGCNVELFYPKSDDRIGLRSVFGAGNALMFQELTCEAERINQCDVAIATNYFGLAIPEIKIPIVTIFHHAALSLAESIENNNSKLIDKNLRFWLKRAEEHNIIVDDIQKEWLYNQIVASIEQYSINHSEALIAVSKNLEQDINKYYHPEKEKLQVIYNSYDRKWEKAYRKKNFDGKKLNILIVTRLTKSRGSFIMKGADRIALLLKKLKRENIQLIISTDSQKYVDFFKNINPNVTIQTNLSHEKLIEYYANAHVSIHLSRIESFGLTLTESMLMGNIPISTAVGIAPEIINSDNGYLVNKVEEIPRIINQLERKGAESLSQMSNCARQTVMEKLNPDKVYGKYLELTNKLAK